MPKTIEEQIAAIDAKLPTLEKKLGQVQKWAFADGNLTEAEMQAIQRIEDKIAELKRKKVALNDQRGVVDFEDEAAEVSGEVRPYDHADFVAAFRQSVNNWCQDKAIKLNSIRTYMIERKEPAGLEVGDVVKVVGMVFPPAAHIGTAIELAGIAERAFRSALSGSRGETPSLNEIHRSWSDALDQLDANSAAAFPKFVEDFKRENGVPSDVHEVPYGIFRAACDDFAKTHMPDAATVEKAFVAKVLSAVKDDDLNPFGEGWGRSGFASIEMCRSGGLDATGIYIAPMGGYLDDVPGDLMQAIHTVYADARVIDLPVQIKVTLENNMGALTTIIERKSRTPGDTNFVKTSGYDELYRDFMAQKAYERPKVKDLKAD